MPTATIDGLEVNYLTRGSGPALLMLAPGGFDTTMEKWNPALIIPGDDPAHATSGAQYLREMLPQSDYWPVMPPEQTPERVRDRILEFGRAHR